METVTLTTEQFKELVDAIRPGLVAQPFEPPADNVLAQDLAIELISVIKRQWYPRPGVERPKTMALAQAVMDLAKGAL